MNNQDKFSSALPFTSGLGFLFVGLMQFAMALTYRPLDNDFLGGDLAIPLAFLLTLLFAIGWLVEWFFEKIVLNLGRNATRLFLFGALLVYLVIALVSFLIPLGFFRFALVAIDSVAFAGFWFRIRPETLAKLHNRA